MIRCSFILLIILCGCTASEIELDPVRKMKSELKNEFAYTITLSDMDLDKDQYKHKYKIFKLQKDETIVIDSTEWQNVSDDFFFYHKNNLGMEVASKLMDSRINDLPTPPGYTNFVGNEKLGDWQYVDSSYYVWGFYEKYKNLRVQLNLQEIIVTKIDYDLFISEYQFNRPYYGKTDKKDVKAYGTNSNSMHLIYPLFYLRRTQHRNFTKPRSSSRSGGPRGGGGYGK
jgi:hypothetical protein